MNTQRSTSKAPFISIVAVFAALVLFGLFALTLQQGIGIFIVFVLVIIALAFIGVWLYRMASAAWIKVAAMRLEARRADHDYEIKRAELAYKYQQQALPAPTRAASAADQIDMNALDLHSGAINFIMFSRKLLGDGGNRLASAPECAGAGIMNYSARNRDLIVKYLAQHYGVVAIPGPIDNGGGTYVPENIGTIGALYQMVLTNSAVRALPKA